MEDNVKSFLDRIQEINEEKISVEVVSTGKTEACSPLTFKQQKELISTIADGAIGALKFQKYLNTIIIDNMAGGDLKISDKLPIILKLRSVALGNKAKIGDDEIDLDPILKKAGGLKCVQPEFIEGDFTISLEIPTISYESQIIQATIDILKKTGDVEIGKNIGHVYTYEIVKYIKTIGFSDNVLVFSDISVKDRAKIVENLPISVNRKIIAFIQKVKTVENDLLTVEVNGESKTLDIDVGFFDS